jgi:hypothetical protein
MASQVLERGLDQLITEREIVQQAYAAERDSNGRDDVRW